MIYIGFKCGAGDTAHRVHVSVVWKRFHSERQENWRDGGALHLPEDIWERLHRALKYITPVFGMQVIELSPRGAHDHDER